MKQRLSVWVAGILLVAAGARALEPIEERIGPLAPGMFSAEVERALGAPEANPGAEEPGRVETIWHYPAQDLTLTLVASRQGLVPTLESIVAGRASPLHTTRGIGIGSTRADVLAAYGEQAGAMGMDNLLTLDLPGGYLDIDLTPDATGERRVERMVLSAEVRFTDDEELQD